MYALNASSGWLYVGGKFSAVRDAAGNTICAADNLTRLDESTGQGDCTFTPTLPGTFVHGIAVIGNSVYVGG